MLILSKLDLDKRRLINWNRKWNEQITWRCSQWKSGLVSQKPNIGNVITEGIVGTWSDYFSW